MFDMRNNPTPEPPSQPSSSRTSRGQLPPYTQAERDAVVQQTVQTVAADIRARYSRSQVIDRLVARNPGLARKSAESFVDKVYQARDSAVRKRARRDMLMGGLICVIGIVVTVTTYSAVSSAGGGSYVVAWGAIIFGGIQFLRGLFTPRE